MGSPYFVGACTGKSASFSPLTMNGCCDVSALRGAHLPREARPHLLRRICGDVGLGLCTVGEGAPVAEGKRAGGRGSLAASPTRLPSYLFGRRT
jgi:hypothetical protein